MRDPLYTYIAVPVTEAKIAWEFFRAIRNLHEIDAQFIPASGGSFFVLPIESIREFGLSRLLRGRRSEAILHQFSDFLSSVPLSGDEASVPASGDERAPHLASRRRES